MHYQLTLGAPANAGGEEWGEWEAETPEGAVLAALNDNERVPREPVRCLSNNASFGEGAARVNGNGAQDRSDWWFVSLDGTFVGVYAGGERSPSRRDVDV